MTMLVSLIFGLTAKLLAFLGVHFDIRNLALNEKFRNMLDIIRHFFNLFDFLFDNKVFSRVIELHYSL